MPFATFNMPWKPWYELLVGIALVSLQKPRWTFTQIAWDPVQSETSSRWIPCTLSFQLCRLPQQQAYLMAFPNRSGLVVLFQMGS